LFKITKWNFVKKTFLFNFWCKQFLVNELLCKKIWRIKINLTLLFYIDSKSISNRPELWWTRPLFSFFHLKLCFFFCFFFLQTKIMYFKIYHLYFNFNISIYYLSAFNHIYNLIYFGTNLQSKLMIEIYKYIIKNY
jgi:hypothetical protein